MKTSTDILKILKEEKVDFLQMQFIDIFGINKVVELPSSQFKKALNGEIMFDGSSIEGFTRIEESDMILLPDNRSFRIFPWTDQQGKIARIICDIYNTDGSPFAGCPRMALKKVIEQGKELGYEMMVGPELEFFLFMKDERGVVTLKTHDVAGYFDMAPVDLGDNARRDIVHALQALEFEVEASHHEVAEGQHEIDFRYEDALKAADNMTTFKYIVKKVAADYGLHATFIPKPIYGSNGSGMHCHQSLFAENGENVFFDQHAEMQLSQVALSYVAGILAHAKAFVAITNPLVNSYKRLKPGYEAPVNIAWSEKNRSPLIRVPARRGSGTRIEVRLPDPSSNPYLALAVMLRSGLDAVEKGSTPPPPVNKNIFTMSHREKRRLKIDAIPENLLKALEALKSDKVVRSALGEHIYNHFFTSKIEEWRQYTSRVHQWELDNYISVY